MLVNPVWEGVRLTERLEGDLHPPTCSKCPRGRRAEGFPQRSVFADELQLMFPLRKKKKSLVCYFGLHLWKLHLSESACWNTTFFCDVTTGQRCLSQFRDHTSDPRDPFRGPRPGVCSTGRDGRAATFPIMREVFTGGELKRFFDRGCKQRANYAVSLRSADLVLLN